MIYVGRFAINAEKVMYIDLGFDGGALATVYFENGKTLGLDELATAELRADCDEGRKQNDLEDRRTRLEVELAEHHVDMHEAD